MPDPFFENVHDGEWNALVGRSGDELNYVDGYIEAAQVLAAAILDDSRYGQRDTLILPILFNARHAVELALKFAINKLLALEVITGDPAFGHDIRYLWQRLRDAKVGDLHIREIIAKLAPFVESLASIDEDGQELRYAIRTDEVISLANQTTVNIPLVRRSLDALADTIKQLVDRIAEMTAERVTKTFTRECSRYDLRQIAETMGPRSEWTEASFADNRTKFSNRFDLSNGKFSKAIDAILASRELSAILGETSALTYISDEKAVAAMTEWQTSRDNAVADDGDHQGRIRRVRLAEITAHQARARELSDKIKALLSLAELADLATLYELGLLRAFGETYPQRLEQTLARFQSGGGIEEAAPSLMNKTNLLDCLINGATIAGRPTLARQFSAIPASITNRSHVGSRNQPPIRG